MAGSIGSLRHSFAERSKERLLIPRKEEEGEDEYSQVGSGIGGGGRRRRAGGACLRAFHWLADEIPKICNCGKQVWVKACEIGRSDPRKIIFALKMGLALSFVTILIFFKEPLSYIGQHSIWAILTVVVVFEFSIGTPPPPSFSSFLFPTILFLSLFTVIKFRRDQRRRKARKRDCERRRESEDGEGEGEGKEEGGKRSGGGGAGGEGWWQWRYV